MSYFICEVIRDPDTGDQIAPIKGAITGWEVRFESKSRNAVVDYEYVPLDSTGFDIRTASVQDDGNGEPELYEDATKVTAQTDADDLVQRSKRREFGGKIIDIMSQRNDAKSLDQAQLETLIATYATINTMLLNGSISTARALINAVTPDGTITTADDKTALLAEIDANLTALGY